MFSLKKSKKLLISSFIIMGTLGLTSCVTTQAPKISHVHIGHAMTAWKGTPGEKGLFITAENEAKEILSLLSADFTKMSDLKKNVQGADKILNPQPKNKNKSNYYGFVTALTEARDHILYAADSKDASVNVKKSAEEFAKNIEGIVQRSELLTALNQEIIASKDFAESKLLIEEVKLLAQQNLNGYDSDSNSVIGNIPEDYGIKQLKNSIEKMISREKPAYQTIDKKYLYGLIRLPSGVWEFFFGEKERDDFSGY